jgi:hypothetical protein
MTEGDWLSGTDPREMLDFLRGKMSERRMRLFAVQCCIQNSDLLQDHRFQAAIRFADHYADGAGSESDRLAIESAAFDAQFDNDFDDRYEQSLMPAAVVARPFTHEFAAACSYELVGAVASYGEMAFDGLDAELLAEQSDFIRDIFGNPFRPVALTPGWRTSTAVSLAQAIYHARTFDRMLVLADALEDAGCDNADILAHCRGDGPHVRGCWVVDLVLGKH